MKIPSWLILVALVTFGGLAFYFGRQSKPSSAETSPALIAARIVSAAKDSQRVTDSVAAIPIHAAALAAQLAANKSAENAKASQAKAKAYADSVAVLNDSVVRLTSNAGVVSEVTIPPQVVADLRAKDSTIAAQTIHIAKLDSAVTKTAADRNAQTKLALDATKEVFALKAQQPLEIAAAYAHGKRDGMRTGLVLGSVFGVGVTFVGVKVYQAVK